MKKRLRYVAPLRCGIVLGILYTILSVVFVPFMLMAVLFGKLWSGGTLHSVLNGVFLIAFPVIYGVLGFILGIIAAALYNLVAKWTGGLEFEVTDA